MGTLTYIFNVSWFDIFVAGHSAIISVKVWYKNWSYINCWGTAIFVNDDTDLHIQGQMLKRFLLPAAMPLLWSKFCSNWSKDSRDISKILKRYPHYDLDLWCQGPPRNFYSRANYFPSTWWKSEENVWNNARDIQCFNFSSHTTHFSPGKESLNCATIQTLPRTFFL